MKRPNQTFPLSPGFAKKGTPNALPDVQIDPKAFEELIKNRGLRWMHEKATQCPNLTDLERQDHDPNCTMCENGMVFYGATTVHGLFVGNRLERMYEVNGRWDVGEAVVTFSAYTDGPDGEPGSGDAIDLQHFDKVTCLDYSFRWQELVEHSQTGIDRLRYPALTVEYLRTKEKVYTPEVDFVINEDGHLKWTSNNQPGYDQNIDRGEIFTIAYCARPVFYVVQLLHELRATKAHDLATNQKIAIRLPQQVLIRRDYLFTHPADKTGEAEGAFPRSGGNITPG